MESILKNTSTQFRHYSSPLCVIEKLFVVSLFIHCIYTVIVGCSTLTIFSPFLPVLVFLLWLFQYMISLFIIITKRMVSHTIIFAFLNFLIKFVSYKNEILFLIDIFWSLLILFISVFIYVQRDLKNEFNIEIINLTSQENQPVILRLYKWYKFQRVLAHLQTFTFLFLKFLWRYYYEQMQNKSSFNVLQIMVLFPWYLILPPIIAFTMIRGVKTESKTTMILFYFCNLLLIGAVSLLLFNSKFLIVGSKLLIVDSMFLTADPGFDYFFIVGTLLFLSFLIMLFSVINSFICSRNFGKNLKIYLNHQS